MVGYIGRAYRRQELSIYEDLRGGAGWGSVLKALKGLANVSGHGDVGVAFGVIPFKRHTAVVVV